jgi:glycolate oxidase FAD binding subunit
MLFLPPPVRWSCSTRRSRSGARRLRYGPVRDSVLEARFVTAEGKLVKAGGPVVKNVTGYDLCRLLVGSLGTLGLLGEVVLRCYPVPAASQWFEAVGVDPFDLYHRLYRPSAIVWDGRSVWVLLEGHPADVAAQVADTLGPGFTQAQQPPRLPAGRRLSVPPGQLARLAPDLPAGWMAEVGVGTVHTEESGGAGGVQGRSPDRRAEALQAAVKTRFDPTGRLNPGRTVP